MNMRRIASLISGHIVERPDYGTSGASVPRGDTAEDVVKTRNEDEWCVVSPKNEDWSGGCYGSPGAAHKRLDQVEMFKHMNA